jgi:thiol-disulfide isomerase/thioredoxin
MAHLRFIMLALSVLAIGACDRQAEQPSEIASPVKGVDRSKAGQPIPDAQLTDADGETATLANASGRPLLVNLWATWCVPCIKELPTLQQLGSSKGAPRVIAVSQDMAPRGSVDAFLQRNRISDLEVWHDREMALSGALGAEVLPTTILYDARGGEVWRYVGELDWTGEEAARLLAEAGARAP